MGVYCEMITTVSGDHHHHTSLGIFFPSENPLFWWGRPGLVACEISVLEAETEPVILAVEAQSPDH